MATNITPNMQLPVPVAGQEPGPQYAFDVDSCFTLLDSHDHSPGRGVQITPSGLNINASFNIQNQQLNNVGSALFFLQTAQPVLSQSLYAFPGGESPARPDLWYYDGTTQIQITKAGNVNAAAASIPGESYSGGTFFWKQGSGSSVPANFDIGSITIRPNVASTSNGSTVLGATSGSFSLQLPNASTSLLPSGLPASTVLATVDSSGNISTLAAGTSGQVLTSQGISGPPQFISPTVNKAPTIQQFKATSYFTFTTIALTVATNAGAAYTNNGQTFTVVYNAAIGATTLVCAATGAPTSSGVLTFSSGTGQSTIVFSSEVSGASYQLPSGPSPLYIKVTAVGAGGGGSSGNGGGNGGTGGNSTFGSASLIVATGGGGGSSNGGAGGGPGGAGGIPTSTLSSAILTIGAQGGAAQNVSASTGSSGGGSGAGGGGVENTGGFPGAANTGGGGGGAGSSSTNVPGSGGGSGGAVIAFISSPSSSYPFVTGAGGGGGTGGGTNGGSGGSGIIVVEEYYQ